MSARPLLLAASSAPSQGVHGAVPSGRTPSPLTSSPTSLQLLRSGVCHQQRDARLGLRMQAVEHGAGAIECAHFYNTSGACTLVFTADSMYRVLEEPSRGQKKCCRDTGSLWRVHGRAAQMRRLKVLSPTRFRVASREHVRLATTPAQRECTLTLRRRQKSGSHLRFPPMVGCRIIIFTETQTNRRPPLCLRFRKVCRRGVLNRESMFSISPPAMLFRKENNIFFFL